ncbi:hypothetical protein [Actinoplanes palleronii]|uniref:Uncharacterized protein n=1 Tax=Actinoplanes palleronii TaxID=113570 RepID=A0ABQ4BRV7_9ACTN|nr:hypothetical protein [Actinoplanes palleronii]GIE73403.1 hypothetical protein Apa02nite_095110 [Actinoplanes palleronii]
MTTADNPGRQAAERLAEALGLPPLAPWTAEDEATFTAQMEKADRDLAELIARRKQQAA